MDTKPLMIGICLAAGLALAGCPDPPGGSSRAGDRDAGFQEYAKLKIADEASNLLFTYLLADGSFQTVDKVQDVPEGARNQVIVVDTQRPRAAHTPRRSEAKPR